MKHGEDGRVGKMTRTIGKIAGHAAVAALSVYAVTQLAYHRINDYNVRFPSEQRVVFMEEFDCQIRGLPEDVEKNGNTISTVGWALQREKNEAPFDLESITIEPGEMLKKTPVDQLDWLIGVGHAGYYMPGRITLLDGSNAGTTCHEVKHAKTFEVMDEHPEFLEKWNVLAVDTAGKSLYLTSWEQLCSRTRGLASLVDTEKKTSNTNEALGFTSDYARTNMYEDVAELCELAELSPDSFGEWLDEGTRHNPAIAAKVALAEEYDLLPPEFSEYVALRNKIHQFTVVDGVSDVSKAAQFLDDSQAFLEQHQGTIYESELRRTRGWIFRQLSYGFFDAAAKNTRLGEAIAEYKQVLEAKYKDPAAYTSTLSEIAECYDTLGNKKKAKLYTDAHSEFWKRYGKGDISLATEGVNDFLASAEEAL